MSIKLVTGNTIDTNVEAADDRAFNAGIVGIGDYVLDVGRKFGHEIINNNIIRILDGEGVMQGAHFRIEHGKYDDVMIDSGTSGYNRIDLICAKYTKFQNAETVEFDVVKGIETVGVPLEPEITIGNILNGDPKHYMPLKKVVLQGTNITIEDAFVKAFSFERINNKKLLWSGAYYMNSSQNISLSEKISEQATGIELVFAPYVDGSMLRRNFEHFFISKSFVQNHEGHSSAFSMVFDQFRSICQKYLYIWDDHIIGVDYNTAKGTSNGVTYDNSSFVLAEIYGV